MDCENIWPDGQNESSNSTTSRAVQQCSPYITDPSYISFATNPAFYNVPHYGSNELPSSDNYLAGPYQGNINSYHPYYNHGNAMAHENIPPFLGAQHYNAAMKRKNCSQINHLPHMGIHTQGSIMRSNRKNKQKNKKQLPEKNKRIVSFRPTLPNYINAGNNNQQKNFGTTSNICKAIPASQSPSIGNDGNRNDNAILNESSFKQTNLQHSTASENLKKSSTNFNLSGGLFNVASAANEVGLDFESDANIHRQEENIINFANEDSNAGSKCNVFDDLFKSIPDVNNIQPLDRAHLPEASKETLLLNAQNTINLVMHNSGEGEVRTSTLQKISEVEDENGKNVILLSAAPEIQQQIAQGNGIVDKIPEAQTQSIIQAEENTPIREDAETTGSTFISNEDGLNFEQNNAVESEQVTYRNTTFASNIEDNVGHETSVKTTKIKTKKRRRDSLDRQIPPKKLIGSNSRAETAVLPQTCLPKLRVNFRKRVWRARLKREKKMLNDLLNQSFSLFAEEYFKENHINADQQLRNLMMIMLNNIGGSVLRSICCFFGILSRNYNPGTYTTL